MIKSVFSQLVLISVALAGLALSDVHAVQEPPTPSIEILGTAQTGDDPALIISLDPGDAEGQLADWWLWGERQDGFVFAYNFNTDQWAGRMIVSAQKPLKSLNDHKIPVKLPSGISSLYFGVDLTMNGKQDEDIHSAMAVSLGQATVHDPDQLTDLALIADNYFGPLTPLLEDGQTYEDDWPAERLAVRESLSYYLGERPDTDTVPLNIEYVEQEEFADYLRYTITFQVAADEIVPAYLLVPNGYTMPRPAVLALHQTVVQGKDEPVGIEGRENMAYGEELAQRGYVVLAPDEITAGKRILPGDNPYDTASFDSENPDWSAMGKMLYDHQKGIDLLQGLASVDPERIGVIGHSLGGYNALFLGAFDKRVKAVVASSAYTRIETDPGKERWARESGFVHFPRLRPYVEDGATDPLPWDFHHVLALIAPTPLFQSFGLQDQIFPNTVTAAQVHQEVAPLYNSLAAREPRTTLFNGPHDFDPDLREKAYTFLDGLLMP